jgi:hypothetical protein
MPHRQQFQMVLALNGIPCQKGLFITTSSFTPRCLTIGVRTIDGKQLLALERRAVQVRRFRVCSHVVLATFSALCLYNESLEYLNCGGNVQVYTSHLPGRLAKYARQTEAHAKAVIGKVYPW